MNGIPMDETAAELSREMGGVPEQAMSRSLTKSIALKQDLLLVMTAEHRTELVQRFPSLLARTFTLREFARLSASLKGTVEPTAWGRRQLVREAFASRGQIRVSADRDDVMDPYRQSIEVHKSAAQLIDVSLNAISRALSGSTSP